MSQHSSLRISSVGKRHRNVFKRYERIRKMTETERWGDRQSVYGLPKIKSIQIKVKKAKSEKAEAQPGQAAEIPTSAPAPAAPPKAKEARAKGGKAA